jgi:hypothetical protein
MAKSFLPMEFYSGVAGQPGRFSEGFWLRRVHITIFALLPLAFGMAGDAYVVLARITGTTTGAAIAAGLVLLVLLGFWYAWPFADRLSRQRRPREPREAKQV